MKLHVRYFSGLLFGPALLVACQPSSPAGGPGAAEEGAEPVDAEESADLPEAERVEEGPNGSGDADATAGGRMMDPVTRAVLASDRSEADRTLDAQRKPIDLFRFFEVEPGQRVAELMAGGGYSAEILARIVGPEGRVYGQNSKFVLERFAKDPWEKRLSQEVMKNVVRVDAELEAPLPKDVRDLDAVFLIMFYHDAVWLKTDRKKMNRAIFDALKPGGVYAIVDHSARKGDGSKVTETLHRIEETTVVEEVLAAGFVLDASADFLRNPADSRDWNASPGAAGERRGESDRFVLRFKKPAPPTSGDPVKEPDAKKEPAEPASQTLCTEPRKSMCTKEYRPVCATVDTGIRCVRAPCPSTEVRTYSNACSACADPKVVGHTPGACPSQ